MASQHGGSEPEPMTKAWYDAQHAQPEPERWGFPGAGIASLVVLGLSVVMSVAALHFALVNNAKREVRDECIAYYTFGGTDAR